MAYSSCFSFLAVASLASALTASSALTAWILAGVAPGGVTTWWSREQALLTPVQLKLHSTSIWCTRRLSEGSIRLAASPLQLVYISVRVAGPVCVCARPFPLVQPHSRVHKSTPPHHSTATLSHNLCKTSASAGTRTFMARAALALTAGAALASQRAPCHSGLWPHLAVQLHTAPAPASRCRGQRQGRGRRCAWSRPANPADPEGAAGACPPLRPLSYPCTFTRRWARPHTTLRDVRAAYQPLSTPLSTPPDCTGRGSHCCLVRRSWG